MKLQRLIVEAFLCYPDSLRVFPATSSTRANDRRAARLVAEISDEDAKRLRHSGTPEADIFVGVRIPRAVLVAIERADRASNPTMADELDEARRRIVQLERMLVVFQAEAERLRTGGQISEQVGP